MVARAMHLVRSGLRSRLIRVVENSTDPLGRGTISAENDFVVTVVRVVTEQRVEAQRKR
jgi:hypothetical protein